MNFVIALENKFFPVKCWKKSMLLYRMLKKYGFDVKLHFGVSLRDKQKNPSPLYGHSWITIDNSPVFNNDIPLSESLTEILSYP